MTKHKEIVFEILGEGGDISIQRIRDKNGEKFFYHHNEMDLTDEGRDVNEIGMYQTFEQPFNLINERYPWFQLHLQTVSEEYKNFVLEELIQKLQHDRITPDELKHSKNRLEEILNVKLEFSRKPLNGSLQNIKVENLVKLTQYDYQEFTDAYAQEIGQKFKLKGTFEVWFPNEQSFQYDQVTMSSNLVEGFETIGKLEVNGNTITIKNEFDQIAYVLPSDKFFISTSPILSKAKTWFYQTK